MTHNTIKLMSWNVNGLRAVIRKGTFMPFVRQYQPDILCLQETKAEQDQAQVDLPEYEEIWNSAERSGYAGTAIFTKIQAMNVVFGIPGANHNDHTDGFGNALNEGRVLTMEFGKFFLVNVYTPNSKRGLERLKFRQKIWDPTFLKYLISLEKIKPVVFCGDLNVAHKEIDLARPKDNRHNAGFTDEERAGADAIVQAGFVDSFRHFYPDLTGAYTWWSAFRRARERNIGWRIDYFFMSSKLIPFLQSARIHSSVMGSDHCPVEIRIKE